MKVSELLSSPDKWTQGCPARDATGLAVIPLNRSAVSFCLVGAVTRCYASDEFTAVTQKLKKAARLPVRGWLSDWNDEKGRTFEQVIAVVKRARI